MYKFEKIIKKDINFFDKEFQNILSTKASLLYKVTKYVSHSSGKRIRPICTIIASGIVNNITEQTYRAAILIELLHTATLIHDDIVDDAQLRRGVLSINTIWKNKTAVLTGDYFLAKGLQLAVIHKDYDVLNSISEVVQKIVEGELFQIEKTKQLNLTEEDYFKIIKLKTASLFQCAFQVGGAASKADQATMLKLSTLGVIVGNLFQIKDDILDYDSTRNTGKKSGNDIEEGKINLPLLYSMQKMNFTEKNQVYRILRKKINSKKEINLVQQKVLKYQGIMKAQKMIDKNFNQAIDVLDTFENNNYKEALKLLLGFLIERNK